MQIIQLNILNIDVQAYQLTLNYKSAKICHNNY